jgi:hypothetical protein
MAIIGQGRSACIHLWERAIVPSEGQRVSQLLRGQNDESAKLSYKAGIVVACHKKGPWRLNTRGLASALVDQATRAQGGGGTGLMGAAQCGLLEAALIQTLADLQQFESLRGSLKPLPSA